MTVVKVDDIWSDPSDGYIIRVVRCPDNVVPEGLLAELKTQWREYRRAKNATVVAI